MRVVDQGAVIAEPIIRGTHVLASGSDKTTGRHLGLDFCVCTAALHSLTAPIALVKSASVVASIALRKVDSGIRGWSGPVHVGDEPNWISFGLFVDAKEYLYAIFLRGIFSFNATRKSR